MMSPQLFAFLNIIFLSLYIYFDSETIKLLSLSCLICTWAFTVLFGMPPISF